MTAPPPVGIRTGARYRVVDEARIVEMLVLLGWAIDARLGRLEAARRDAAETLERWIGMGLACKRWGWRMCCIWMSAEQRPNAR